MRRIVVLCIPILICQCSSMERSIGLGAGIGAAAGATTGHAVNFNMKGMALTTATGAVVGGLVGLLLHKDEKMEGTPHYEIPPNLGSEPILQEAEKEVLWIPGKIDGDRYTEPHRIFVIKQPSRWAPPPDKIEDKNERPEQRTKKNNSD